ncbi:UDP-N-acetylmuramate dehydrogenase [Marinitoga hydrogenitolerans DSM 16785]|uniref:UDP-N-acetylenolpyruvoylglucosamine reductase n=1 Tax=Marinitoga hydrogenitolerans (strain DSM 16785 / JCM 12826 / AT1271) TaxID=1122195 RepID=A0A1M4TWG0_MARH1|nr:UDP-N-acetylmuramate dehydrogenase [Marinitoga hydrogenitolerans]SHE48831.1 UDP-N-acetylmuramate dehydrogenase [Marinitoga hydrogenitolerans DSM 16785]
MNLDQKYLYTIGCNVLINEPMSAHTTFKIGGKAPYFIIPKTKNVFIEVLKYLSNNTIPFRIIGGGANLIIKDEELDFVVVSTEYLTGYKFDGEILYAEVGIPFSRLSYLAMENNLSGLEFAAGIPGSLGGALFMNAGAYGGQISDVVEEVEVFDLNEKKNINLRKEQLSFDYRKSIFQKRRYISLSAKLKLFRNKREKIEEKIKEFSIRRWEKQPLEYPSAGSIFKRPKPDFYVGTTIEKLGLKGCSVGDAEVSKKHAGFIINKGNAKFKEVFKLIEYIKDVVRKKYNIDLEVEPEIWE